MDSVLVCAVIPAITFVLGMLYGRYVLLAGHGHDIDPDPAPTVFDNDDQP